MIARVSVLYVTHHSLHLGTQTRSRSVERRKRGEGAQRDTEAGRLHSVACATPVLLEPVHNFVLRKNAFLWLELNSVGFFVCNFFLKRGLSKLLG